ncbi:MAG: Holliday junction branch migration protein RuvA [Chloroflexi bacterium]|jgi:Holliday junction DNA helicase RuvA|nr:Holliday junction branch migration protein RuvA [Chloroflexota bacterium]MBL17050.1 Holliday junction branch migration protein RuvA [Chloroflexota bacterium]MDP6498147.1 Holliday junction branch migration protein RuvA [Dehalococcoidia bacterium]MQG10544.1 Holliday junction branch migration protein RuvA [SAR202 cluster bacterium]MQG55194.1 Holliday junction branch migration protein RuvA [SAR202 cluster bacterium]|tara:strand:+ start:603 stop:1187 length:585 start_codon:yes stop_codon:yes gene_type:complete
MIVGVHGTLETTGPDWVHVRVGGVTLEVSVPANTVSSLGAIGSQVTLHTHLRIRDEEPVLFGFSDAAALGLFSMLTGVSGVGPRTALALLSSLDPARLQTAIVTGDTAALSSAQGVGGRTASRIVLDLKGKLEDAEFAEVAFSGDVDSQVIAALTALGYSPVEARAAAAVPAVAAETEVDDRIRVALQQFATRG